MLKSLKDIGEVVLSSGEDELEIAKIKRRGRKKGGENYLVKIIFDLDNGILDYDCSFKCDESKAREYLWVGNAVGKKHQMVLTTDKPKYLLDPTDPTKWSIGEIINKINEKGFSDYDIRSLQRLLINIKEKFFPKGENLVQEFENLLAKKRYDSKDLALYTVSLRKDRNVVDLVKEPGYKKFLHYVLYETESGDYPIMRGRCHICGEVKEVLTNPSYPEGTLLNIYNVDKLGFFPDLSNDPANMLKAHVVCVDCKKKLRLGLNFVERNLTGSIGETATGRLNLFLIPAFVGTGLDYNLLQEVVSQMKDAFNAVKTYGSLRMTESEMRLWTRFLYSLNLLFGYRVSSHFSFQYLIQDVPVTRFLELEDLTRKVSNEVATLFDENIGKWYTGFEEIYSIFPLKKSRDGKIIEWKLIVELFDSMLKGTFYSKETIISRAVLYARILRYGTFGGYNIKEPKNIKNVEVTICEGILKYNILLRILELIVTEREESSIVKVSDENKDDIDTFFSVCSYSEWQKALFLLGVLVGRIGIEQYTPKNKKKAVLNKINFEGMSVERVKILANYVLEGLRNYRILDSRNEATYARMKEMLDRNLENLRNPVDNVFYILSGYAYATYKAITSGGREG